MSEHTKYSPRRVVVATFHQDSKAHCKACDKCQRTGKPLRRDEMPLNPQMTMQPFEKWAIDFVGPIKPQKKIGVRFTVMEYLTHWVEAQSVKDCTTAMAAKFLFEHVLTRFGCPKILINDHGTHFLNETINMLTEDFQVYHQKSTPYHPQANGTVEAFNKILEIALTKVCNSQRRNWDLPIPIVLWAYRKMCKKLMGQTPFRLVYGMETVMSMEYIVPSLCIATLTGMTDHEALEKRLTQLDELEEEWFLASFHQQVQKQREKA